MKLGVVTLLRGDQRLSDRWASFRYPPGSVVVAMAPAGHLPDVPPPGLELLESPVFTPRQKPDTMEAAQERCDFILSLYNAALQAVAGTDAILLFEDDLNPPDDAVDRLIAGLQASPADVAGIVTVYPLHGQSDTACLMPGQWGLPPKIGSLPSDLFQVWGGGTGFSIYRTKALLDCVPIRRFGSCIDWDGTIATAFEQRGLKLLCDGSIRCGHG